VGAQRDCADPLHHERNLLRFEAKALNMDLLRWIGEGSNIFGLMVYCAGMTLILGTLALANYADHRQNKQEQSATR
jgi:hypothetical protein